MKQTTLEKPIETITFESTAETLDLGLEKQLKTLQGLFEKMKQYSSSDMEMINLVRKIHQNALKDIMRLNEIFYNEFSNLTAEELAQLQDKNKVVLSLSDELGNTLSYFEYQSVIL
jgi:hypothetical protein